MNVPWPDIDGETCRQMLLNGVCPECGLGSFSVLSQHLSRKHGIDPYAAKEQAMIPKWTGLTSPEYHERKADAQRRIYESGATRLQDADVMEAAARAPHILTAVGIEANRRKAAKAHAERLVADPGFYDRIRKNISTESYRHAGLAGVAARKDKYDTAAWSALMRERYSSSPPAAARVKIPRSEYESVRWRRAAGETSDEIAASYDASRALVNQIVSGRKDKPYLGRGIA